MTHGSTTTLEFTPLGRRRIESDFDGGRLTSDAGGLLLRKAGCRCRARGSPMPTTHRRCRETKPPIPPSEPHFSKNSGKPVNSCCKLPPFQYARIRKAGEIIRATVSAVLFDRVLVAKRGPYLSRRPTSHRPRPEYGCNRFNGRTIGKSDVRHAEGVSRRPVIAPHTRLQQTPVVTFRVARMKDDREPGR